MFIPMYKFDKIPKMNSVQLVGQFIRYELERNMPFYEIMRSVRFWLNKLFFIN